MPEATRLRPGAFRRAIVPISIVTAALIPFGWLMWMAFEGQREDVATARAFLTHVATGQHAEAEALMSPTLSQRLGTGGLQRVFGQIEPWDHIGFSSRDTQSGGSARATSLYGVGETVSGCESVLRVELIGGLIDAFNVTPLCPRTDTDV